MLKASIALSNFGKKKQQHSLGRKNGVLCYKKDDAINSFKLIIKDPENYKRKSQLSIKKYIDDYAFPVSKKEWHNNFNHHINIK